MSFRLPTIDKTKPQQQSHPSEQYNFVNTNTQQQRRRTKDLVIPPVVSPEDLKKKIQEQKRQIQTRNNAIMALQRNFESMAALLKTEKNENNVLREEVEKWRKLSEENGRKATEYYEKVLGLGSEGKKFKEEIGRLGEEIKTLTKMNQQYQSNLKVIDNLTKQNKKLQTQLHDISLQKQELITELRRFSSVQKQCKQYQSMISELKQQIRILHTEKDSLSLKIFQLQQANRVLEVNMQNSQNEKDNLRKKNQDDRNKEMESNGEITKLKNKMSGMEEELWKVRTEAENKNVIIMMKMKTEEELKGVVNDLKSKVRKGEGELSQKMVENEEMARKVVELERSYQKLKEEWKGERRRSQGLMGEVSKGEGKEQELQSVWKELKESRNTVIDLETRLKQATQQYNRIRGVMTKYQQYFHELDSCSPAKILSLQQYTHLTSTIQSLQSNLGDNKTEYNDLNKKLIAQQNQISALLQKLNKYQSSDKELSALLQKEQQTLSKLEKEKQLKQQQILKEKQKNKLLWSDNKKLKEHQEKLLEEIEGEKRELIIKSEKDLKRIEEELREKEKALREDYEKQLGVLRSSNNEEVGKLLGKKGEMIRQLEQKISKLIEQVDFYKNRYKQMQGVSSRTQKKLKQMSTAHQQALNSHQLAYSQLSQKHEQLTTLHNTCSTSILSLTSRLSALQQFKTQSTPILQSHTLSLQTIFSLQSQLTLLKSKLAPYQSQDFLKKQSNLNNKIQLLLKSVGDLSESLISVKNHISCSYCCELPTDTMKMIPCGHVFCGKCRKGYEEVCEECKKGGSVVADKQHDQLITKVGYMQMILGAVKEDTVILGKL